MNKKKIMISIFFTGLLLMGIGSGVAFAEFSSFDYGGRKLINGEMTRITLEQKIPEQTETIRFFVNGYSSRRVRFETDDSMETDTVSVEVFCNQNVISPYIREEKKINQAEVEETEYLEEGEAVYLIDYNYNNSYDEVSEFFKIKEEFLEGIKKKVIYSYSNEDIEKVVIKAPSELMERMVMD